MTTMEGNGRGLTEVISWHFHGGAQENHQKIPSVSTGGDTVETLNLIT
jgi:hypothetical protein